ncbi:MAG: Yip1 family protein, partial [Holophagae bacterium]
MDETDRPAYEPTPSSNHADLPTPRLSAFRRLIAAFYAPGEVFEDIRIKPTWLVVLLAMTILTVAAQAIVFQKMDTEGTMRARLGDRAEELSDEQIETMVERGRKVARFVPVITAVVIPVMWAVLAGIFFLMLKMVGSETDYVHTLSATLHSYWPPSVVASVLVVLLIQRVDSITEQELPNIVKSHLGVLLPADAPGWLNGVASTFSVFNVWTLVLLVIGFKIVGRL